MAPPINPNDPELVELMHFLIEKTKDVDSPLKIKGLAREFQEKSGCSQKLQCLVWRIRTLRGKVAGLETIDTETKAKMIFGLSAPIDENFLIELRKDACVELDGKNLITKYKAKNGSVEFERDHSQSAKIKSEWEKLQKIMDDSLNGADEGSKDPIPKISGSAKRAAAEVPSSSKRTRNSSPIRFIKSEDYNPDDTDDSQSSSAPNPRIQQVLQPKIEVIRSGGAPGVSKVPTLQGVAPRSETSRAHEGRVSTVNPKSGGDDAYTPHIKFLEVIQSFVFTLGMPFLTPLQAKIEKMLREVSNERVPNDMLSPALELMVAKLAHHSVPILSENVESVSLIQLLCYLKATIMTSKLEGLEVLMEKIKERIEEPTSKDMRVPAENVANVLRDTLNNVVI